MKRVHNTNSKTLINSKCYSGIESFKPLGLWYGINNEWLDWCYGEEPDWIKKYLFELDIDMTDVFVISDNGELCEFQKRYEKCMIKNVPYIDWKKVKNDYKGIEIINYSDIKYNSFLTFFSMVFCAWDVSGGCIWDLSVIKNFNRILTPNKWFKNHES